MVRTSRIIQYVMHGLSRLPFSRGRGVFKVSSLERVCSKDDVMRLSSACGMAGGSSFFFVLLLAAVFLVPFFVAGIFFVVVAFFFFVVDFVVGSVSVDNFFVLIVAFFFVVEVFRFALVVLPDADFSLPFA